MTRMHELDEAERALLDALIGEHPVHLSAGELAAELGDAIAAVDAIAGLHRNGLVHRPADGFWFAAHVARYLARLTPGPARATLETLLGAQPAQLSFHELMTESGGFRRDVADGLDELERNGAVHRTIEDFFWPTRPCRRFEQLVGYGRQAIDDGDRA